MKFMIFICAFIYCLTSFGLNSEDSEFKTYMCTPYDQSGKSVGNFYSVISQNSATAASDIGALQKIDSNKNLRAETRFPEKTSYFVCGNAMNSNDTSSSKGMPVFTCKKETEFSHESKEPFEVRATNLNAALEIVAALGASQSVWSPPPPGFKCNDGSKEVSSKDLPKFYCRFGHSSKFDKQIHSVRSSSLKAAISHVKALNGGTFPFEKPYGTNQVECLTEYPVDAGKAASQENTGKR